MAEGAQAWMVPATAAGSPVTLKDLVTELDGLVLQGGSDRGAQELRRNAPEAEWSGDYIATNTRSPW